MRRIVYGFWLGWCSLFGATQTVSAQGASGEKKTRYRLYEVKVSRGYSNLKDSTQSSPTKDEVLKWPLTGNLEIGEKGPGYTQKMILLLEAPQTVEDGQKVRIKATNSAVVTLQEATPWIYATVRVPFFKLEAKEIRSANAGEYPITLSTEVEATVGKRGEFALSIVDNVRHVSFPVHMKANFADAIGRQKGYTNLETEWVYRADPSAELEPPTTITFTPGGVVTKTRPTTPDHCPATFAGEWGDWGPKVGARRGTPPPGTEGTWGTWTLRESGNSVTGSVPKINGIYGPATINATVSGKSFSGTWSAPNGKGKINVSRSADDCTFSGSITVDDPPGVPGGSLGPPGGHSTGSPPPGGHTSAPWDTVQGQQCFDHWIALATKLINAADLGPSYNGLKPYSFNKYGHLVNQTTSQISPPDDWAIHGSNKYRHMWEHYNTDVTAGQWRGTGPDGFGSDFGVLRKAKVPTLRDFMRGCAPGSTPGSTQEPPLGKGMILAVKDPPNRRIALGTKGFLVPVELINAKNVLNLDFSMSYSPQIVAAQGNAEKGSVVSDIWEGNLRQPGLFKFNFAQLTPFEGRGTVAGFRFDAIAVGRTELTLAVSKGTTLPLTLNHGSITVFDPRETGPLGPGVGVGPGAGGGGTGTFEPTCSGTGRQTLNDAQCCLKMWVELIPQNLLMDLNGSGEVDSNDAVIVMQNVARRIN